MFPTADRRPARAPGAHALARRAAARAVVDRHEPRLPEGARSTTGARLRLARVGGQAQRASRSSRCRSAASTCISSTRRAAEPNADAAAALARLAGLGVRVPQADPAAHRALHRRRAVAAGLHAVLQAGPAALRRRGDRRHLRRADDRRARLRALRRAGRRLGRVHHLGARPCAIPSASPASTSTCCRCGATRDARTNPTPEEKAYLDELNHFLKEETGYQWIQGTKPQTLAFGLTDSPAGLAAWIVEKFRTWTDYDGNPERRGQPRRDAGQHLALLVHRRHRLVVLALLRAHARALADPGRRDRRRCRWATPNFPKEILQPAALAGGEDLHRHPPLDA